MGDTAQAPAAAAGLDAGAQRHFQSGVARLRGAASGSETPLDTPGAARGRIQPPAEGAENRSAALLWTEWLRAETDLSVNLKAWVVRMRSDPSVRVGIRSCTHAVCDLSDTYAYA